MNGTSIALCVPAFNAERFLPRLLRAVAAQSVPFDEVWVYDDASWDQTAAVAREWGADVITAHQNSGCSVGKNFLAERSRCDWIHFHDADDSLMPGFVLRAHEWVAGNGAGTDVVLFAYEMREDQTDTSLGVRRFDDAGLRADPLQYAIREQINPFCGLYRRAAFLAAGGYDTDPAVLFNEDVAFHCRIAMRGLRFAADEQVHIVNYCRTESMSSSSRPECARAQFHVMRKVVDELHSENRLQSYSDTIGARLWDIATFAASFCDWEYVDNCILLARRLGSEFPRRASADFRLLARLSPRIAYRLRERLIRSLRPALRAGYPIVTE